MDAEHGLRRRLGEGEGAPLLEPMPCRSPPQHFSRPRLWRPLHHRYHHRLRRRARPVMGLAGATLHQVGPPSIRRRLPRRGHHERGGRHLHLGIGPPGDSHLLRRHGPCRCHRRKERMLVLASGQSQQWRPRRGAAFPPRSGRASRLSAVHVHHRRRWVRCQHLALSLRWQLLRTRKFFVTVASERSLVVRFNRLTSEVPQAVSMVRQGAWEAAALAAALVAASAAASAAAAAAWPAARPSQTVSRWSPRLPLIA